MGRPKTVDDETLISLIDQYFCEFCEGGLQIKLPELAVYVAEHGYPNYKVTTLRRNALARKHIVSLQNNSKAAKRATLAAFQTLDINAFLDKHMSRASLVEALSARDQYYRTIAENAVQFNAEHKTISEEDASLKEQLESARQDLNRAKTELDNAKREVKSLKQKKNELQAVIEKYVCSDIAKTILIKEGIIPFSAGIVSSEVVDKNMITASTNVIELGANNIIEFPTGLQNGPSLDEDDVMKHLYDCFQ